MSEQALEAIKQVSTESVADYFGIKDANTVPAGVTMDLVELVATLFREGIDKDTSIELIRSFESKSGMADDIGGRLKKFLTFVKSSGGKEGLIATVKSMGYLSKSELEEYARETGDWSLFLKRVSRDNKK